jgi:hypothetical protein
MRNSTHAHFSRPHHFFPLLMGFTDRKCVNLGLFWVNLSKSGLVYSVGGRGFRVGIDHPKPQTDYTPLSKDFNVWDSPFFTIYDKEERINVHSYQFSK